jgi:hypothetical protein
MAGLGPDAPYLDRKNKRAGIFGYDRAATKAEITGGLSNTILMIQSDSTMAGPWIAGGGATIRGTSPNGDRDVGVRGAFLAPEQAGKQGTWILMADGSTRFLTKDVSPAAFRALVTITGDDDGDVGEIDSIAPKANLPVWGGKPAPPKQFPKVNVPSGEKKDDAKKSEGKKTEEEEERRP